MYTIQKESEREKNYILMVSVIRSLLEDEQDLIANMANISAFINSYMDGLNWAGFYLLHQPSSVQVNPVLTLGPFQGKPACIRIELGKGVCGTAALERKTIIVDNVHEFPGHIACDSESLSEIVIPLYKDGSIFGVLDLDSPLPSRFGQLERTYLEQIAELIDNFLDDKI